MGFSPRRGDTLPR